MKVQNFPERKRKRQLGALQRLQVLLAKRPDHRLTPHRERERSILIERTASNLRGTRTKKRRTTQ